MGDKEPMRTRQQPNWTWKVALNRESVSKTRHQFVFPTRAATTVQR